MGIMAKKDTTRICLRYVLYISPRTHFSIQQGETACTASSGDPDELSGRLQEYQEKVASLSEQLRQEELAHRELLSEKEARISELETEVAHAVMVASPVDDGAVCAPVESKPKVRILEHRILEMTIQLEEKDRRIFETESELDQVKVQVNQLRVESDRVPSLETTVSELESTLSSFRDMKSNSDEEIQRLRTTILNLQEGIEILRGEIEQLTNERDEAVEYMTVNEEGESSQSKVAELESQLEQLKSENDLLRNQLETERTTPASSPLLVEACMQTEEPEVDDTNEEDESIEPPAAEMLAYEIKGIPMTIPEILSMITEQDEKIKKLEEQIIEEPEEVLEPIQPSPKAKCGGCFSKLFK